MSPLIHTHFFTLNKYVFFSVFVFVFFVVQLSSIASLIETEMSASKSYLERSKLHSNPTAKAFLELMERKKSNLSVAADLTSKAALIELADKVGPYICLLKVMCHSMTRKPNK